MHSRGFELTKLTYSRLEDNLIYATAATGLTPPLVVFEAHRGDRQHTAHY